MKYFYSLFALLLATTSFAASNATETANTINEGEIAVLPMIPGTCTIDVLNEDNTIYHRFVFENIGRNGCINLSHQKAEEFGMRVRWHFQPY
jgi:hypothetical protein